VTDTVPEDTTGPRPHHIEQHRRIKDTMYGSTQHELTKFAVSSSALMISSAEKLPRAVGQQAFWAAFCPECCTIGSMELVDEYRPMRLDAGCSSFQNFAKLRAARPIDRTGQLLEAAFLRGHGIDQGQRDAGVEPPPKRP
jgi:hypothetical protein